MHKAWRSIEEVPYCFSRSSIKFHGHTGGKNWRFGSNLRLLGQSQLSNPSDLPCYVFADIISRYGRHCINMTGGRQLVNGGPSTWLSCFSTCDWLRALVHLHCDIMITTLRSKHGDLADRWWSTCHAYERKFNIKMHCKHGEKYLDVKRKAWRF